MLKKYIKPGIFASLLALPLAGVAEDTINVRILDRDTESGGITWLVKSLDNRDIETVQYWPSGSTKATYRDLDRDGLYDVYSHYHPSGHLKARLMFGADGHPDGIWEWRHPDGVLLNQIDYRVLDGEVRIYNADFELSSVATYTDRILNGPETLYFDDGTQTERTRVMGIKQATDQ